MATGCVTGIEDLSTLDRGEETCVSKREVPQQDGNEDRTDGEVEGGGGMSAPTRHPPGVSNTKDSVNAGDKKPLCRVTAYERTDVSNADQEASSSKANATKVKKKKKKKGKKKEAQEKRDIPSAPNDKGKSVDCLEDLERQIGNLKIRQEGWIKQEELVERGPDRKRDCREIRQSKPYQRIPGTPDDDVSNFSNSIMPDDMMVIDKPTAEVSPQIRSSAPEFPQNQQQLQQHQQQQQQLQQQQLHQFQQQHLLQLQQLQGQQPQQQLQFPQQQFPQQLSPQYMQQFQQTQQQQQQQLVLNSPTVPESAPPSIPFNAQSIQMSGPPYVSTHMQGAFDNNGGLPSIPPLQNVILVPVQCQVNGQTVVQYQPFTIVNGVQVPSMGSLQSFTQSLPPNAENGIVTASPQGQLVTNENSQAANDNPARQGIPTVVPDEFETEVLPTKKKGRGRTPNLNSKKKTSKKSATKAKKSASEPSNADTAAIDAQSDSQCSGASATSSDNVRPGSNSPASATPKSTGLESFEPQLGIPNSRNTCSTFSPLSSVESGSFRQGPTGPKSVGPASVGPASVEPGSVGPASVGPGSVGPGGSGPVSVGPASVASSSVGPGSVCPESIGSNLDFSDFGPLSNGGSLSASNSVAPQSVGTVIEIEDEDSLDVNDFLKKGKSIDQVLMDSPSTKPFTSEDLDELFRNAEEFVESDLKEATASRQADMHSATGLLSQRGTACMNKSINHATSGMQSGFSDQQTVSKDIDEKDFLDAILSASTSEVPGTHEAELVSSLEKMLESMEQPADDSVQTSDQKFHYTDRTQISDKSNVSAPETPSAAESNVDYGSQDAASNMAGPTSARSLDVSVCIKQSPPAFGAADNVVQSQLNIQIGMNRMSQLTSFNKIMGSFQPIVPKRTN